MVVVRLQLGEEVAGDIQIIGFISILDKQLGIELFPFGMELSITGNGERA